jgi:phosphatidylserine/phosphatidylglycerophosphate/cardiolipin synthase-like enzyme
MTYLIFLAMACSAIVYIAINYVISPTNDQIGKATIAYTATNCVTSSTNAITNCSAYTNCVTNYFAYLSSRKIDKATTVNIDFYATATNYLTSSTVYFSPNGGCEKAIITRINNAKAQIHMQAYVLTALNITSALIAAKQRGIDVQVIVDRMQSGTAYEDHILPALVVEGITVYTDGHHRIAHNKVIVIDGIVVITGSYNFTASAERNNAENLLIICDEHLASQYEQNWTNHMMHARQYTNAIPQFEHGISI